MLRKGLNEMAECISFRCLGVFLIFYAVLFIYLLGVFLAAPYFSAVPLHQEVRLLQHGLFLPSVKAEPPVRGLKLQQQQTNRQTSSSTKFAQSADPHNVPVKVGKVANIQLPQKKAEPHETVIFKKTDTARKPATLNKTVSETKRQPFVQLDTGPKKTQEKKVVENTPKAIITNRTKTEPKLQPNVKPLPVAANSQSKASVLTRTAANPLVANVTDFVAVNNNTFLLYAAHYNPVKTPPVVTIVAIVDLKVAHEVKSLVCVYYGGGQKHQEIVSARLTELPDHHYKKFTPAFIHCQRPDTLTSMTTVSISVTAYKRGGVFPVDKNSPAVRVLQSPPRQFNFLICFSPLHQRFDDVMQVVANLELAQRLGAQHAVVYNTSISRRLDAVLRHYVHKGFLEVLGWRGVPEPVHYKAQMGAINDCLLRNRQRADFIAYMDFDEMLVPRLHDTWPDMFRALQAASSSVSDYLSHGGLVLKMTEPFQFRIMKEAKALASQKTPVSVNVSAPLKASSGSWADLLPPHLAPSTHWTVGNLTDPESYLQIGAVSFVSSVFLWDNVTGLAPGELRFANAFHVSYLLKQRRTVQLWPDRAKTIINPRLVDLMAIHGVVSFVDPRLKVLRVNETVGLLHHYRWYNPRVDSLKDLNLLRYSADLVQRMKRVFAELRL